MLHPRDHIIGYVQPAIDMLDRDPLNRVLAANAIVQVDMLVGLLAEWGSGGMQGAAPEDVARLRNDLEDRRGDLVAVRKFRQMHERGELDVRFAAVRKAGRHLPVVMVPNGNGSYFELLPLLRRAVKCWGAELRKRGL